MTSNAGQPPTPSDTSPPTSPLVFSDGGNVRLIQLPSFDIGDKLRQAFEKREKAPHFIPPSKGTPVNSLPNELLSHIFVLGSEAEEDGDDQNDEDEDGEGDEDEDEDEDALIVRHARRLPFKVLVSHVCRRWRLVVLETSTLWTYLNFSEGPPFDKSRAWLDRSKECPLNIELDCTVDSSYDDSDDQADTSSDDDDLVAPEDRIAMPGGPAPIKPTTESSRPSSGCISAADLSVVRDLILPHVSRWRTFELIVDDYPVMHGILSTLASVPEAPQLEGLRLFHYDDSGDSDHFSPPSLKEPFFAPFSGRAPSLMQAALWGVHVDWEACAFLQGLEELELAYHAKDVRPPYEIFSRILQRSPDLHILTLCASGPAGDPGDWPTDVIELPSVKHLVLAFVEPSYASALMKRLVFPNLSTLALDFDASDGDYSSFLAQLARPSPNDRPSLCQNLIDLKIAGMQCSNPSLAAFYAALPSLTSLNLNCYHLPREFFDYLYPGLSGAEEIQGCYLPKLQTLTTAGITGEEMRDLLSSRTAVPIKHILMDSEADVDREEEEWLREKVETFDFFEGSDDEDEDDDDDDDDEGEIVVDVDDPAPAEIDEGAHTLSGGLGATPGEWIDDDDDDDGHAPTEAFAGEAGTLGGVD